MSAATEAREYATLSRASVALREDLAILLLRTCEELDADAYDEETFDRLDTEARTAVVRLVCRLGVSHKAVLSVGLEDARRLRASTYGPGNAMLVFCGNCGRDEWVGLDRSDRLCSDCRKGVRR